MIKKNTLLLLYLGVSLLFSCDPDEGMTVLPIKTQPDLIAISQNTTIEIFMFQNDTNIPSTGTLEISQASKGSAIINNGNTPNDISDDSIIYSANANVIGEDSIIYTICNASQTCNTATVTISITSASPILLDLENVPYPSLTDYNFFEGDLKNLNPAFGVLPYTLNATLFSDYAKKKRFIWMPNNVKAQYLNDAEPLDFPVGTVLIKNFYYENTLPNNQTRILETRLMIRKNDNWIFANYVWNDAQNEAIFDMDGSFVDLQWQEGTATNSVQYRIPAGPECHTCHKVMEVAQPIGPKPRNLNRNFNYNDGTYNQLNKLVDFGYLNNSLPSSITTMPDYNDTSEPIDLRVRSYLDINCAHCHSEETHCAYRPLRLSFSDTEDYTNIGVCVTPDTDLGEGLGHIIEPGDPNSSVLHFRLSSIEQSYRMPLLGRTLKDIKGVALVEQWIDQLTNECE
ncbi:hypothetical protein [uncultured Winogradskyella sp.]|uniref:Ig-like domain-containing protein n=1 Tax=uncultured Winogradskyella sp. TaxID=395353 RepID=UPI00261F65A6|nr:hypothetical protein [uncultured Winogradskyella sp.]